MDMNQKLQVCKKMQLSSLVPDLILFVNQNNLIIVTDRL